MREAPLERHPIYQQLNDRLRSALASEYRRGDQFLTEREIARRFGVSRPTANKALAGLVSEGLLELRRGIGTFVQRDAIGYDVQSLVSFTEKARAAGKRPSTTLLRFGLVRASEVPEEIAASLECAGDEPLWEMERLRLADGTPVILECRYVSQRLCPLLTRAQAAGSLYQAWTRIHGLRISGADTVIRAVPLKPSEARHLQAPARSPALEVRSVGRLAQSAPLWWERTLYRGDQYEFQSQLGPLQLSTPARGKLRST